MVAVATRAMAERLDIARTLTQNNTAVRRKRRAYAFRRDGCPECVVLVDAPVRQPRTGRQDGQWCGSSRPRWRSARRRGQPFARQPPRQLWSWQHLARRRPLAQRRYGSLACGLLDSGPAGCDTIMQIRHPTPRQGVGPTRNAEKAPLCPAQRRHLPDDPTTQRRTDGTAYFTTTAQ